MMDTIFSMNTVWWTLMIVYIPACIGLIGIVLLQQGKGGGFGGALGGGSGPGADTVFGPKSHSMPVKITYAGAALFMTIAIILSVLSGKLDKGVAPDLIDASGDVPTLATSNSLLSQRGLGTGIIDEDRSTTPEVAPKSTEIEVTTPEADTTDTEATDTESPDASE